MFTMLFGVPRQKGLDEVNNEAEYSYNNNGLKSVISKVKLSIAISLVWIKAICFFK